MFTITAAFRERVNNFHARDRAMFEEMKACAFCGVCEFGGCAEKLSHFTARPAPASTGPRPEVPPYAVCNAALQGLTYKSKEENTWRVAGESAMGDLACCEPQVSLKL